MWGGEPLSHISALPLDLLYFFKRQTDLTVSQVT